MHAAMNEFEAAQKQEYLQAIENGSVTFISEGESCKSLIFWIEEERCATVSTSAESLRFFLLSSIIKSCLLTSFILQIALYLLRIECYALIVYSRDFYKYLPQHLLLLVHLFSLAFAI